MVASNGLFYIFWNEYKFLTWFSSLELRGQPFWSGQSITDHLSIKNKSFPWPCLHRADVPFLNSFQVLFFHQGKAFFIGINHQAVEFFRAVIVFGEFFRVGSSAFIHKVSKLYFSIFRNGARLVVGIYFSSKWSSLSLTRGIVRSKRD